MRHGLTLRELTPQAYVALDTCESHTRARDAVGGGYINPHVKALTDKTMEFIPNADSPAFELSPTISVELSLAHMKCTRFLHSTKR